jgi:hypothetical protein
MAVFTRVLFVLNIFIFYSQICGTNIHKNTDFGTISVQDIEHITKTSCILAGSESLNDNFLNVFQKLQVAFKYEPSVRIALLKQDKDLLLRVKWDSDFKPSLLNDSVVFFPRIKADRVCLNPKPKFVPAAEVKYIKPKTMLC